MPQIKQSAECPHCRNIVRWTVPFNGDGSVWLLVRHTTVRRGAIRCNGSKMEVTKEMSDAAERKMERC